jgi:hypothetical protein
MKYNAYPKKVRKRDIDAEERPFKLDLKIVHYAFGILPPLHNLHSI